MFDIAIDSKLRGCDVVKLRIGDAVMGGQVRQRSMVIQQKTGTRFWLPCALCGRSLRAARMTGSGREQT